MLQMPPLGYAPDISLTMDTASAALYLGNPIFITEVDKGQYPLST